MPFVAIIVGGLGALGCLIGAFWALRRKCLIDDLPTSKAEGVFIGLVELKGTAESASPLTSYLGSVPCVQYSWHVEEHWSRTVTETYTDAQGHTRTRTRTESGWTRVASDSQAIPFYLKDDTGVIRVVPEHATIHSVEVFDQTCSPDSALYFEKGPGREIADSTHRRRFQESGLTLHTALYVMGQARERQDVVAAEIAYDKAAPMFLISTQTEKQISRGYGIWYWSLLVLGAAFAMGGSALWKLSAGATGWEPYAIAAGGFAFAALLGWVWTTYNSLVNLRYRVEQGWSQVDVQLKRRHDLIPNLVETVQGYGTHESTVQTLVAELRAQTQATPPGVMGPDFRGVLPLLKVVIERYPDLKANSVFLQLQRSLSDTEQRIALARDYFNNIATFYNIRLAIIPDRFVAALARLRPRQLMSASDFERAPVEVKLVS